MKTISTKELSDINGGNVSTCAAGAGLALIFLAGLVTGPAGWAIIGLSAFSWGAVAGAAAGGCAAAG